MRADKVFEETQLAGAEFQARVPAPCLAPEQVEGKVGDFENGRVEWHAAPGQGAHAGDDFGEHEGFWQIIVRAEVETVDSVVRIAAGGEKKHRRGAMLRAQFAKHIKGRHGAEA